MASEKFSKDSKEWNMFADYWDLCPKIAGMIQDFKSKYSGKFVDDLILALLQVDDFNKDNLKKIFTDYWKLCQELWNVEMEDSYWEQVIDEANKFYDKYKTNFAKKLTLALTDSLEMRFKEMNKKR